MKLYSIGRQSLRAIFANKGRSFLTTLGIVIGIGSVIALISLGAGVKASISQRISTLGSKNLMVTPGGGFGSGDSKGGHPGGGRGGGGGGPAGLSSSTLTDADLASLSDAKKNPHIKAISANVSGSSIFKTTSGDQRYSVTGISASYFEIEGLSLAKGKGLTASDISQKNKVIVLGDQLSHDLYGNKNPVGKSVSIGNQSYSIVGVLKKADESGFSNPNSQAYVPNSSAKDTFKSENFNTFVIQAKSDGVVDTAKADATKTLLANHKIKESKLADFSISSAADLLSAFNSITTMLTSLLAGIAAISLLVGGIGIMNIMLVSVTERTHEIGLRKAVGAKTFDILSQFVIEAVALTLSGGLLGIGLGVLMGRVAAHFIGFTPLVTGSAVLLAVGISSIVGLVFGVYPAAKAARLDPIEALRYE